MHHLEAALFGKHSLLEDIHYSEDIRWFMFVAVACLWDVVDKTPGNKRAKEGEKSAPWVISFPSHLADSEGCCGCLSCSAQCPQKLKL